jgi:hypothetical protein
MRSRAARASPPSTHLANPHTPFVVVNRAVNPLVRALLRSPAHGLVSSHLALITVTGRRSGRTYTFPVGYHREGDLVTIGIDWPERKRWWRNLREPAPVELRLAGERRTGTAVARGDEHSGVTVEVNLTR